MGTNIWTGLINCSCISIFALCFRFLVLTDGAFLRCCDYYYTNITSTLYRIGRPNIAFEFLIFRCERCCSCSFTLLLFYFSVLTNIDYLHCLGFISYQHAALTAQLQESSAKLTNQRVSYAFTCSPFSFHACHILPASKFQYSYSCILLIFYRHQ